VHSLLVSSQVAFQLFGSHTNIIIISHMDIGSQHPDFSHLWIGKVDVRVSLFLHLEMRISPICGRQVLVVVSLPPSLIWLLNMVALALEPLDNVFLLLSFSEPALDLSSSVTGVLDGIILSCGIYDVSGLRN